MKETDSKLTEIVNRLAEAYHPERIYLFGSAARGDFDPDLHGGIAFLWRESLGEFPESSTADLSQP